MSILSKFINANHHYNLAIDALEKRQYQKSLEEFNQTLRLNPRYTLAFINRGKLKQQRLNRFTGAADDYKRALKLDSHDDQTRYRLAVLDQNLGRYRESAQNFNRILIDANWTKRSGVSTARHAFDKQDYQKATRLMHRILSTLDFH